MLVEDEPFIALDLELLVTSAGHLVVGVADSLPDALQMAQSQAPEAALVDLNLRDGMTGLEVARELASSHDVTVGFVTGNAEQIPADFAGGVAVVEKPFTDAGVGELMEVLERIRTARRAPCDLRYARLSPALSPVR